MSCPSLRSARFVGLGRAGLVLGIMVNISILIGCNGQYIDRYNSGKSMWIGTLTARTRLTTCKVYIPCMWHDPDSYAEARMPDWTDEALRYFETNPTAIYAESELVNVLSERRVDWTVPRSVEFPCFVRTMMRRRALKRISIRRATISDTPVRHRAQSDSSEELHADRGTVVRYSANEPSVLRVALSLRVGAYLSHATAMSLHGLIARPSGTVYVNKEQTPKPRPGSITQTALDTAFRRPPRVSRDAYRYRKAKFLLLSGKQTGRLGVIEIPDAAGGRISVTGLERSLVDAVVRPVYAGGALQVLRAYRAAKSRCSVGAILEILMKLEHVYPYHQAIGFYMQRAGYSADDLKRFRALGLNFDFYLEHGMAQTEYDSSWRLYYPAGM